MQANSGPFPSQKKFLTEFIDRRTSMRLHQNIPAKIVYQKSTCGMFADCEATITNLSEHGFLVKTDQKNSFSKTVYLETFLPDVPECFRVPCAIRWYRKGIGEEKTQLGLEILENNPISEDTLHRFFAKAWASKNQLHDRRVKSWIETFPVSYKNRHQRNIQACIDRFAKEKARLDAAWVILPPDFGETKTSNTLLSYYLAMNGFSVLRYDATDHVGESDGKMEAAKLSTQYEDMIDSIHYLKQGLNAKTISIVASGIAARLAMRIARQETHLYFLATLLPAINLEEVVEKTYGEPLFQKFTQGKRWTNTDMFGFPVDANSFLEDAIDHQFHLWSQSAEEMANIKIPFLIFAGDNDSGTSFEAAEEIVPVSPDVKTEIIFVPNLKRIPCENALTVLEEAMTPIITKLRMLVTESLASTQKKVLKPDFREVMLQMLVEREKIRSSSFTERQETDDEFWGRYLERFHFAIGLPEYRSYYERVTSLSGTIQESETLFDAGCGNGNYGVWLLFKQQELKPNEATPFHYIGADFSSKALLLAQKTHQELIQNLRLEAPGSPQFHYELLDLNKPLPYLDNYFDKIVCNLVLTYLTNPSATLREFIRVLKPKKKIALTTVRPNADFSIVYRGFLEICKTEEERDAARRLLRNTADLLEKERQGLFRFFTEQQLLRMVEGLDVENITLEKSLAGQLNILMLQKK